jgi:hypothetical protein
LAESVPGASLVAAGLLHHHICRRIWQQFHCISPGVCISSIYVNCRPTRISVPLQCFINRHSIQGRKNPRAKSRVSPHLRVVLVHGQSWSPTCNTNHSCLVMTARTPNDRDNNQSLFLELLLYCTLSPTYFTQEPDRYVLVPCTGGPVTSRLSLCWISHSQQFV